MGFSCQFSLKPIYSQLISNIAETEAVARSFLDLVPDESVTCRLTVWPCWVRPKKTKAKNNMDDPAVFGPWGLEDVGRLLSNGMDAFRVDSDDEWDDLDGFVGEMICTWGFNMIQTTWHTHTYVDKPFSTQHRMLQHKNWQFSTFSQSQISFGNH